MHARQQIPVELRRLAEFQAGALSSEQLRAFGVSRSVVQRLVRQESWHPMARGLVYAGPSPAPWLALAWAGLLAGGERSRLGAAPSAHLYGLIDEPEPITVLVPSGRRVRLSGPWEFVREAPGARSPRSVGSPPRLSVEAAVLDLAAQRPESEVVGLLTTAVQQRTTRPEWVLKELARRSRHRHRRLITAVLTEVAIGAESPLELRFLHDVERAHGLPTGRRQRARHGLAYRCDVGYDAFGLLVELDGRTGHLGTGRFDDQERDNQFMLRGWLTLRYGWYDVVDHPCRVAAQIAAVLHSRGWTGTSQRCQRCAAVPESDLWSA